jgi:putative flippase GtrA
VNIVALSKWTIAMPARPGDDLKHDPGDSLARLRMLLQRCPRPLRFLGVGGMGLTADLVVFTLIPLHAHHPLEVRLVSLAAATCITWRLNRAITFNRSGRRQREEVLRYIMVTVVAQGTSYAVFAALVLSVLGGQQQVAAIIGAAIGAFASYTGQRLFAFAPLERSEKSGTPRSEDLRFIERVTGAPTIPDVARTSSRPA